MLALAPISARLESWNVSGGGGRGSSLATDPVSFERAEGDFEAFPRTCPFVIVRQSSRGSDRLSRRKCHVSTRATLKMEVEEVSHEETSSLVPVMVRPGTPSPQPPQKLKHAPSLASSNENCGPLCQLLSGERSHRKDGCGRSRSRYRCWPHTGSLSPCRARCRFPDHPDMRH